MKLSEMNGEQLATCLCIIAEPLERMADDNEIADVLRGCMKRSEDGKTVGVDIPRAVLRMMPVLLGKYRRDTFKILGAMNGKNADEIAKQNGLSVIRDIKACFDKDLFDFFSLSVSGE